MKTPLLTSMRPRQWSKNVFLLAALVFARQAGNARQLATALAAFGCFCLASSSVYLINDCLDSDRDRHHPTKRNRPIAAGELSVGRALMASLVLMTSAVILASQLGNAFLGSVIVYIVMNLGYSLGLKSVVILDVMIIAAGFVLRAVAGGLALHVEISHWLALCTTMLALFLAVTKRRQELVHLGKDARSHRRSLSEYNVEFLDQMISVTTSTTVMSYALYTVSPEVVAKFGSDRLKWTVPFVIFGIFRYLYLIHVRRGQGDPTVTLLSDFASLLNVACWSLAVVAVLY